MPILVVGIWDSKCQTQFNLEQAWDISFMNSSGAKWNGVWESGRVRIRVLGVEFITTSVVTIMGPRKWQFWEWKFFGVGACDSWRTVLIVSILRGRGSNRDEKEGGGKKEKDKKPWQWVPSWWRVGHCWGVHGLSNCFFLVEKRKMNKNSTAVWRLDYTLIYNNTNSFPTRFACRLSPFINCLYYMEW